MSTLGYKVTLPLAVFVLSPFAISSVSPARIQSAVTVSADAPELIKGEKVRTSPVRIEGLAAVLEREANQPKDQVNPKLRNGRDGLWQIASRRSTYYPHSGVHNAFNKWGDARLGIGFKGAVDLHGLWIPPFDR